MRCLWPGTRPRAKVPDLVAGKGGHQHGKRCQLEVRLAGKIHIHFMDWKGGYSEWFFSHMMILMESLFQVELVVLKLGSIALGHRIWRPNDCFFSAFFDDTIPCWWFLFLYGQFTLSIYIYIYFFFPPYIYIYIYIIYIYIYTHIFPIPAILQDAEPGVEGCKDVGIVIITFALPARRSFRSQFWQECHMGEKASYCMETFLA